MENGFVSEFRNYLENTLVSCLESRLWLKRQPVGLDSSQIAAVHYISFKGDPNAGRIRRSADYPGDLTVARIPRELDMAKAQFLESLQESKGSELRTLIAVAEYYVKFMEIKPFKEGNETIALNLMEHQLNSVFPKELRNALPLEQFREAAAQAVENDNLAPVVSILLQRLGREPVLENGVIKSRFQLQPMTGAQCKGELVDDIEFSRRVPKRRGNIDPNLQTQAARGFGYSYA
jgi:fido (protein-threonine AMPylation protein)